MFSLERTFSRVYAWKLTDIFKNMCSVFYDISQLIYATFANFATFFVNENLFREPCWWWQEKYAFLENSLNFMLSKLVLVNEIRRKGEALAV